MIELLLVLMTVWAPWGRRWCLV